MILVGGFVVRIDWSLAYEFDVKRFKIAVVIQCKQAVASNFLNSRYKTVLVLRVVLLVAINTDVIIFIAFIDY